MYRCLYCGNPLNTAGDCPNWRCSIWRVRNALSATGRSE